jgi:hypothetical protein
MNRTMTETELVEEIKNRASDLNRRSTMWEHFHRVNAPENLRLMLELVEFQLNPPRESQCL